MATAGRVPVGIAMPQFFQEGPTDMGLVRQFVTRAEELGYESLWTQEDITGDDPSLEPLTQLSYVAALTTQARLGVSVMVAPLRNPVQLAKALGSIDQLSDGRLTVGVGIGGRQNMYPAFGITTDRRARRFVELLDVMKALWTEPLANLPRAVLAVGRRAHGTQAHPEAPPSHLVRRPSSRRPATVPSATVTAGWAPAPAPPPASSNASNNSTPSLRKQTAIPATFPISKRVYLALDDNEATRRAAHNHLVRQPLPQRSLGPPSIRLGQFRQGRRGTGPHSEAAAPKWSCSTPCSTTWSTWNSSSKRSSPTSSRPVPERNSPSSGEQFTMVDWNSRSPHRRRHHSSRRHDPPAAPRPRRPWPPGTLR